VWLMHHGAEILGDRQGVTVLHLAAKNGQLDIVKFLINTKGVDVNLRDRMQRTAMHYAQKHFAVLKHLEEHGADLFDKDIAGRTAVLTDLPAEDIQALEWLIKERNMDVKAKDVAQRTVLHYTIRSSNLDVAKWLVEEANADIHN
jgi:ankyrin repeat protein